MVPYRTHSQSPSFRTCSTYLHHPYLRGSCKQPSCPTLVSWRVTDRYRSLWGVDLPQILPQAPRDCVVSFCFALPTRPLAVSDLELKQGSPPSTYGHLRSRVSPIWPFPTSLGKSNYCLSRLARWNLHSYYQWFAKWDHLVDGHRLRGLSLEKRIANRVLWGWTRGTLMGWVSPLFAASAWWRPRGISWEFLHYIQTCTSAWWSRKVRLASPFAWVWHPLCRSKTRRAPQWGSHRVARNQSTRQYTSVAAL